MVTFDKENGVKVSPETEASTEKPAKSRISSKLALGNIIKGMLGPGCLAMPMAFKSAGWVTAFIAVFIFGLLNYKCMEKLVECVDELSKTKKTKRMDYGELAYQSANGSFAPVQKFGTLLRYLVNASMIGLQMGICCVQLIFVVTQLTDLLALVMNPPSTDILFIITFPFFLAISSIYSIRAVSFISMSANILLILVLLSVLVKLLFLPSIDMWSAPFVTDFTGIITSAGSIVYALEGQAIVLPIKNRMKYPEKMSGPFGVLSLGMLFVTTMYASTGALGYRAYGERVQDTITLNFDDDWYGILIKVLFTVIVYAGFILQLYPVVDAIWPPIKAKITASSGSHLKRLTVHLLVRYSLVVVVFIASALIPNLHDMIPLVGSTAGMSISLVFPPLLHIFIFAPKWEFKLSNAIAGLFDVFCILIGLFFAFVGFCVSMRKLIGA